MIKLKQAVIVEGKYDKIKLESFIDALIIPTDGFGVFKDRKKRELIKTLAKNDGIIIMTDSDSAGFLIRSHINGFINEGDITNVYIPDILGKEKRKSTLSKEGKLGVEGISVDILKKCLKNAGVNLDNSDETINITWKIKKSDLYEDGFFGMNNSSVKRKILLKSLNLPENLSANALIQVIPKIIDHNEYRNLVQSINEKI